MATNIKHRFIILAALFVATIVQMNSYALPAKSSSSTTVEEFIAKQQIIRTYEDGTPNFGDLATTLSTMDRVRKMGFKGTFEFIYSPEYNKIRVLFNLPDKIPSDYFDKEKNIRFITFAEYAKKLKQNTVTPITLSIVSGGFSFASILKTSDPSITWNPDTYPYSNDAYMLKSKAALVLTVWMQKGCSNPDDPDDEGEASNIYLENQEKVIKLCRSPEQFLVAPFTTFSQAKSYLQSTTDGQRFIQDKPAFNTLLSIIENKTANMIFAYGNGISANDDYSPERIKDIQTMLGIISGVRYAQTQNDNIKKPVVILVFKKYNEQTSKDLVDIINYKHWDKYDFPGKQQAVDTIEKQQLSGQFDTANITDSDAEYKLSHLQPGHILLLILGSLPKNVFDGIYNYTASNIWPAIREGENAKNSLLLNGRPHMRVTRIDDDVWEPSNVGYGPDQFDSENSINETFNNLVFTTTQFWTNLQPTELVGQYILESQKHDSALSRYFVWLKEQALKPENDRIYSGLKEVITVIDKSDQR